MKLAKLMKSLHSELLSTQLVSLQGETLLSTSIKSFSVTNVSSCKMLTFMFILFYFWFSTANKCSFLLNIYEKQNLWRCNYEHLSRAQASMLLAFSLIFIFSRVFMKFYSLGISEHQLNLCVNNSLPGLYDRCLSSSVRSTPTRKSLRFIDLQAFSN